MRARAHRHRSRTRTATSRAALVAGWTLAAGMTVAAGARVARSETQPWLIGVQGTIEVLLLPAGPLAAVAAWRGQRALAAIAGALCVAQVTWTVGAIGWHGDRPAPVGAVQLRLVTANILLDNPRLAELGADLARSDADVVVLQEVTPEHAEALSRTSLWAAYPHRVLDPLPGPHGSAILSRYPIRSGGAFPVAGYPMTRADVLTPAGVVRVVDVHAVAPLDASHTRRWVAQLAELSRMAPPAGGSLVLAGDFNATMDHAPLQRLVSGGLRDAFDEAGRGWGATWPRWDWPMPPVMRLDHVLVSDAVTVTSVRDEVSVGSDHRRLVVELAVPVPG